MKLRFRNFPFFKQRDRMDCGPTCIKMIAMFYGKSFTLEDLKKKSWLTSEGATFGGLSEAAENIGFNSIAASIDLVSLKKEVRLPCIVHWRQRHFVVLYKIRKKVFHLADPAYGLIKYSEKEFLESWIGKYEKRDNDCGNILMLEPTPKFFENERKSRNKSVFNFLLLYFKPYYIYIIQLFFGLIIGSLIQLIFPFLTQVIVDYGISNQNLNFVYIILLAQLVLYTSKSAVELIRSWILLHITSRVNINLISDFLVKLMRLPISFFDSRRVGDIIQRIYDHNRIRHFLSTSTLDTLFSIISIVIFGAVLAFYDLRIFLVFLVGSVIYVGWTLLFMKKRAELDYKRFDESSDNQSHLFQLISAMPEIKLNGSERKRRWEWEEIQVKLFKNSIKGLGLSQLQNTGGQFLNESKNILITFISAKLVIEGELTLGMMLSIQYIIGQLNFPINNFITFIQSGQDAKLSLERLSEIHLRNDEEDLNKNTIDVLPNEKTVYFKNVSFQYGSKSSSYILKDLNFSIPEGKITAIVGASGSGKTTLLKLLLKFYEPTDGCIYVGKVNLRNIRAKIWRNICGVVMQKGFLFDDTIVGNITESNSEIAFNKESFDSAVHIANLKEFICQQPQGLDELIGSRGVNVSGGEKQRILIARAVYKNPSYIFFDEATSALDTNNERVIMNNLNEFYKGKTVLVIAHRLSTVKKADQIIVLEKGRIVEIGTHDELVKNKKKYHDLVKNQLELENL
ncbi:peptidase domain-containing ABC transporter [Flagellimonas onchidii]|uniref:peptidase domain-containing ABC transporter n=1 Tax=Flagellimonas onchidii TaxID=2562684 RepID=UPI0010A60D9E|nr:peptidase domain-containing ABC transporter [Allomuricauda onchidii]